MERDSKKKDFYCRVIQRIMRGKGNVSEVLAVQGSVGIIDLNIGTSNSTVHAEINPHLCAARMCDMDGRAGARNCALLAVPEHGAIAVVKSISSNRAYPAIGHWCCFIRTFPGNIYHQK